MSSTSPLRPSDDLEAHIAFENGENFNLSKEERSVIRRLLKLGKDWPENLLLFSHSGTLSLFRMYPDGSGLLLEDISGIFNDGGDPDVDENGTLIDWVRDGSV